MRIEIECGEEMEQIELRIYQSNFTFMKSFSSKITKNFRGETSDIDFIPKLHFLHI